MICCVFDTETTGLVSNHLVKIEKQPEIIEFYSALVDLATGAIQQELECLIKPANPIQPDTTRITGMTDEILAHSPPFKFYADKIAEFIEGSQTVLAHNLSFDKEMVDIEFERLNRHLSWPHGICTVEQTAHLKGHRQTLTSLYESLFDETFKDAHRAKPDTQALIRCAVELYKRGMI